jgi:hypothetical protein
MIGWFFFYKLFKRIVIIEESWTKVWITTQFQVWVFFLWSGIDNNIIYRLFSRGFFFLIVFLRNSSSGWGSTEDESPTLFNIKWWLSYLGCIAFLQKCCHKWRPRRCLCLHVVNLIILISKTVKISFKITPQKKKKFAAQFFEIFFVKFPISNTKP